MVVAYRLLLGVYTGIVPDGIAGLGVSDIDWAGDAAVLLSYVKGRTAAESLTLPRRAVRLLEQWLEHSAPLRDHAPSGLRDSRGSTTLTAATGRRTGTPCRTHRPRNDGAGTTG